MWSFAVMETSAMESNQWWYSFLFYLATEQNCYVSLLFQKINLPSRNVHYCICYHMKTLLTSNAFSNLLLHGLRHGCSLIFFFHTQNLMSVVPRKIWRVPVAAREGVAEDYAHTWSPSDPGPADLVVWKRESFLFRHWDGLGDGHHWLRPWTTLRQWCTLCSGIYV